MKSRAALSFSHFPLCKKFDDVPRQHHLCWLLWNLIILVRIEHMFCSFFSCPYFRNEVGGENERSVALSRGSSQQMQVMKRPLDQAEVCSSHTPQTARGFCLLDTPETYWKNGYCPYEHKKVQQGPTGKYVIERIDCGSSFYKNHFYGQGESISELFKFTTCTLVLYNFPTKL